MAQLKCFIILNLAILAAFANSTPLKFHHTKNKETEEAISIALESTSELLPDSEIISKIQSDLRLIRRLNPSLASRVHHSPWRPGHLLLSQTGNGVLSPKQVKQLEESEFKPVKFLPITGSRENVALHFKKPFHPEHLVRLIKLRFGLDSSPIIQNKDKDEGVIEDRILYRHDLSTYFWNSKNGRNCLQGCFAQYSVSFSEDGNDFKNGGIEELFQFQNGHNEIGKK